MSKKLTLAKRLDRAFHGVDKTQASLLKEALLELAKQEPAVKKRLINALKNHLKITVGRTHDTFASYEVSLNAIRFLPDVLTPAHVRQPSVRQMLKTSARHELIHAFDVGDLLKHKKFWQFLMSAKQSLEVIRAINGLVECFKSSHGEKINSQPLVQKLFSKPEELPEEFLSLILLGGQCQSLGEVVTMPFSGKVVAQDDGKTLVVPGGWLAIGPDCVAGLSYDLTSGVQQKDLAPFWHRLTSQEQEQLVQAYSISEAGKVHEPFWHSQPLAVRRTLNWLLVIATRYKSYPCDESQGMSLNHLLDKLNHGTKVPEVIQCLRNLEKNQIDITDSPAGAAVGLMNLYCNLSIKVEEMRCMLEARAILHEYTDQGSLLDPEAIEAVCTLEEPEALHSEDQAALVDNQHDCSKTGQIILQSAASGFVQGVVHQGCQQNDISPIAEYVLKETALIMIQTLSGSSAMEIGSSCLLRLASELASNPARRYFGDSVASGLQVATGLVAASGDESWLNTSVSFFTSAVSASLGSSLGGAAYEQAASCWRRFSG